MDRLKRSGRRHAAARQDSDLDGLDFLRDTDDKESRPKSTKKNSAALSNSTTDGSHNKQGGSKKEGGWGAENNDMQIVDSRLQRNSSTTDALTSKNVDAFDEDDDD